MSTTVLATEIAPPNTMAGGPVPAVEPPTTGPEERGHHALRECAGHRDPLHGQQFAQVEAAAPRRTSAG